MSRHKPMSQKKRKRMARIFSIVMAGFLALLMIVGSIIHFFV